MLSSARACSLSARAKWRRKVPPRPMSVTHQFPLRTFLELILGPKSAAVGRPLTSAAVTAAQFAQQECPARLVENSKPSRSLHQGARTRGATLAPALAWWRPRERSLRPGRGDAALFGGQASAARGRPRRPRRAAWPQGAPVKCPRLSALFRREDAPALRGDCVAVLVLVAPAEKARPVHCVAGLCPPPTPSRRPAGAKGAPLIPPPRFPP